jgi:hypothetical protein
MAVTIHGYAKQNFNVTTFTSYRARPSTCFLLKPILYYRLDLFVDLKGELATTPASRKLVQRISKASGEGSFGCGRYSSISATAFSPIQHKVRLNHRNKLERAFSWENRAASQANPRDCWTVFCADYSPPHMLVVTADGVIRSSLTWAVLLIYEAVLR